LCLAQCDIDTKLATNAEGTVPIPKPWTRLGVEWWETFHLVLFVPVPATLKMEMV